MRTRRVAISIGAAALVMLAGEMRAAQAQSSNAALEASQKADVHFREGNDLYTQAKFAEAEAAYEKAWSLKKAHDIAANLGYAEMRQGKTLEALEHLAFAVRTWPPTGKEDKRQYAVERYLTLRKEVGAISVEVNRAGAEIYVDGKKVGIAPLETEVFIEAGTRVVEAKLAGFESARKSVLVEKGSTGAVWLDLLVARGATGDGGTVAGGNVPAAGSGTGGGRGVAGTGVARDMGTPKSVETGSGPRKGLIIAGAATSAFMVGAGVVFAVVANAKDAESDGQVAELRRKDKESCTDPAVAADCAAIESTASGQRTFGNLALWSFVIGGTLAAGTTVYALVTPRSGSQTTVRVAPAVMALGGGVVVAGSW